MNIPEAVRDVIIPIFSHEYLASDDLLSKCLHGQTQCQRFLQPMHLEKSSEGNFRQETNFTDRFGISNNAF